MRAPSPSPIRAWKGFHILKGNLPPYGEAPYPPLLAAKDSPFWHSSRPTPEAINFTRNFGKALSRDWVKSISLSVYFAYSIISFISFYFVYPIRD